MSPGDFLHRVNHVSPQNFGRKGDGRRIASIVNRGCAQRICSVDSRSQFLKHQFNGDPRPDDGRFAHQMVVGLPIMVAGSDSGCALGRKERLKSTPHRKYIAFPPSSGPRQGRSNRSLIYISLPLMNLRKTRPKPHLPSCYFPDEDPCFLKRRHVPNSALIDLHPKHLPPKWLCFFE
jgi:hypothetical protein